MWRFAPLIVSISAGARRARLLLERQVRDQPVARRAGAIVARVPREHHRVDGERVVAVREQLGQLLVAVLGGEHVVGRNLDRRPEARAAARRRPPSRAAAASRASSSSLRASRYSADSFGNESVMSVETRTRAGTHRGRRPAASVMARSCFAITGLKALRLRLPLPRAALRPRHVHPALGPEPEHVLRLRHRHPGRATPTPAGSAPTGSPARRCRGAVEHGVDVRPALRPAATRTSRAPCRESCVAV